MSKFRSMLLVGLGCATAIGVASTWAKEPPAATKAGKAKATPVAAKVGEWPQWRGPLRDAVSTEKGLLPKWEENGPPLAWRAKGLGQGYSSVSVADGKIFTMGKRENTELVIARSIDDGSEVWATPIGGQPWGDGPRSTPTYDEGFVYAVGPQGSIVCLNATNGELKWRKGFKDDFGRDGAPGWGFCESPLVDGPIVLCSPGADNAAIVALNKKTGAEVWRSQIPNAGGSGGYSSIVISQAAGTKQYVQLLGRGIVGIDARTGKLLWTYDRIANGTANIPTPLVKGDTIFASTGYGAGAALVKIVHKGKEFAAEEVYFLEAKEFQNHHGGMVLVGDHIYCGHGHNQGFPICIDYETGKVAWRQPRGPGEGSAAVVYADGNLYFLYDSGLLALIRATTEGYQERSSFKIPDAHAPMWAHPVVAGGRLYLRNQDELQCYDLRAAK